MPLFILQKKVVRLILNCKNILTEHTTPLFKSLELLPVFSVYTLRCQMFIHNYFIGKIPSIFNDMFVKNSTIHNYSTRQADLFHLPQCKRELSLRSFKYVSLKRCNELSSKIDYNKKEFKLLKAKLLNDINH